MGVKVQDFLLSKGLREMLWFSFSFPEGISEIPFTAMASRVISYSFLPSENKGKVCVLGTGSLSAGLVMLSRLIVV